MKSLTQYNCPWSEIPTIGLLNMNKVYFPPDQSFCFFGIGKEIMLILQEKKNAKMCAEFVSLRLE